MSTQNALNAAIYNTLSGGTALTTLLGGTAVYFGQAPQGSSLPYVVWSYQGGGDANLIPSRMKDLLVYVRGYAASPALAGSIDYQIDALLHDQTLTVSGWTNYTTMREDEYNLVENPPTGGQIWSSGASYRIRLS